MRGSLVALGIGLALSGCAQKPVANEQVARTTDQPLTDFHQDIDVPTPPTTMAPGASTSVQVTVKNTGNQVWSPKSKYPVNFSYEWMTPADALVAPGERTPLTSDVAPGQSQTLSAIVVAPAKPGQYQLRFTLVQESVAWFDSQGGKFVEYPVTIQ